MATTAPNWLAIILVVIWLAAQYGCAAWALRDLWRRPRVRGEKKVLWAMLILIVPIVGPLLYSSFGPTSFLPRRAAPRRRPPALRRRPGSRP